MKSPSGKERSNPSGNRMVRWSFFPLLLLAMILLLSAVFLRGHVSFVHAEDTGNLQITVIFQETDVSLEAQVMLITGFIPIILSPGEDKVVDLSAGTYQMTVTNPQTEVLHMPVIKEVTIVSGQEKKITVELQPLTVATLPGTLDPVEIDEPKLEPGKATDQELRELLDSEDEDLQLQAFNELHNRHGMLFLKEIMEYHHPNIREWSLNRIPIYFAEKGPAPGEDLLAGIMEALTDNHSPVRVSAANALQIFWPVPAVAIKVLTEGLQDPNNEVRASFLQALGGAGAAAGEASDKIIVFLQDEDARVRKAAAEALGNIGVGCDHLVNSLGLALQDADTNVRQAVLGALAKIDGPVEERAVMVAKALKDEQLEIRREAALALSRFNGGVVAVVPEMKEALKDSDSRVRSHILDTLARLKGEELAQVIENVAKILEEDDDRYIRVKAARVLQAAGPEAIEALPSIINALSHERNEVIQAAIRALIALGIEPASTAIPRLTELLLLDMVPGARDTVWLAADALVRIGEKAIPTLVDLLYSDRVEARARGATVLGRIGPPAEVAVERLEELLFDEGEDDTVRREAYWAITHITGVEPEL